MIKSVALIGIGAMGAPMARRIRASGFELRVCDKSAEELASFAVEGVPVTQVAGDTASADLVLVMVATAQRMRDVVIGDQGIPSGISEREPIIGFMSTVGRDAASR